MAMPRKLRCTVESVADHGGRVYTVTLATETPAPAFRAGQFLHLAIDAYDGAGFWPESRVFSIASSPKDRGRLSICYSVKGAFTGRMENELKPGAEVWAKLPYGDFLIDPSRDTVLLAGGTGVSAFTAFIEGLEPNHPRRVLLAYGARSPELLLSRTLAERRATEVPAFSSLLFVDSSAGGVCLQGPISLDAIWPKLEGMSEPVCYLSGPPKMIEALGAGLRARGVPDDRIRKDAWE
ncbi:MAG TPA: FAD-dependent oxidoreductase [Myxococcales bacterium]